MSTALSTINDPEAGEQEMEFDSAPESDMELADLPDDKPVGGSCGTIICGTSIYMFFIILTVVLAIVLGPLCYDLIGIPGFNFQRGMVNNFKKECVTDFANVQELDEKKMQEREFAECIWAANVIEKHGSEELQTAVTKVKECKKEMMTLADVKEEVVFEAGKSKLDATVEIRKGLQGKVAGGKKLAFSAPLCKAAVAELEKALPQDDEATA